MSYVNILRTGALGAADLKHPGAGPWTAQEDRAFDEGARLLAVCQHRGGRTVSAGCNADGAGGDDLS